MTRRAADSIRHAQRRRRTNHALAAEPAPEEQSPEVLETFDSAGPLAAAMAALPSEQRVVIALYYKEEFSVAEIAVALEVPAGTVKTRLMHARRKLRATLEGENTNE